MRSIIFILSTALLSLNLHAQLITQTGSFSVARADHSSELLSNGKVLAFGGNNGDALSYSAYSSAALYNSGSWTSTGSMNRKRNDVGSTVLSNGNVLAVGGDDDAFNPTSSCEIYDVTLGTWSYTDSLTTPRSETRVIVLDNGNILAVGGAYNPTCELYDQGTGTWSVTDTLSITRSRLEATKLADGNVLVTGGSSTTAEIYDVAAGTWSDVPNLMNEGRNGSSAILLSNGKVLIAGGNFTNTAEVYDPATDLFTLTGDLDESTSLSPMVNLTDGRAMIYGLGDLFALDKKALQVYDPATNSWSSAGSVSVSVFTANRYTVHNLQTGSILYAGGNFSTGNGANTQCYLVNEASISGPTAPTGVNEMGNHSLFEVFPNPTHESIVVKVNDALSGSNYNIVDLMGSVVLTGVLSAESTNINLEELATGQYILQVGKELQNHYRVTKN